MEKITIWTNCAIFIQEADFLYESTTFSIKNINNEKKTRVQKCGIIDLDKENLEHLSLYSFYDKLKILIRLFLTTYKNHICTIVVISAKLTNDDNCFKIAVDKTNKEIHFMKLKIRKETKK